VIGDFRRAEELRLNLQACAGRVHDPLAGLHVDRDNLRHGPASRQRRARQRSPDGKTVIYEKVGLGRAR